MAGDGSLGLGVFRLWCFICLEQSPSQLISGGTRDSMKRSYEESLRERALLGCGGGGGGLIYEWGPQYSAGKENECNAVGFIKPGGERVSLKVSHTVLRCERNCGNSSVGFPEVLLKHPCSKRQTSSSTVLGAENTRVNSTKFPTLWRPKGGESQ